jgi:hypothetical protein
MLYHHKRDLLARVAACSSLAIFLAAVVSNAKETQQANSKEVDKCCGSHDLHGVCRVVDISMPVVLGPA